MSEIGLERPLASAHSELTPGHDVTQLLSQINSSFKKSKADQILRLLKDQDKLHGDLDEIQLEKEYNQIKEEKVTNDSDTLTDSSSDNETLLDDVPEDEVEATNKVSLAPSRMYRSKTAVGFYKNNKSNRDLTDIVSMETDIDTRDISVRPKSSYVRRHFRRKDELGLESETTSVDDFAEQPRPRPSRSARPQSRHGRASLQRTERKIEMVETEVVEPVPTEQVVVKKDTVRTCAVGTGGANPFQDRFQSSRKPTRESKRQKAFCDNNSGYQQQAEPMCVDQPHVSADVSEVVDFHANSKQTRVTSNLGPVMSAQNNIVPKNQHIKQEIGHSYNQTPIDQHPQFSNHVPVRNDPGPNHAPTRNEPGPNHQHLGRHEPRPERSTIHREANHEQPYARHEPHVSNARHDHGMSKSSRVRRVDSNNSFSRPRNPESIPSRQIERPEVRPNTQRRRLQRRYMPQTHNPMSNVRPTSESVILARQKTENKLLKKQADNRPHSEKIVLNSSSKNILSVNENPAQGPQTHLMTKDGVAQSSHVQAGDYRRYDPASRLKNGARSRDIPADLTLPRPGPNNVMLGGRKPLALMKLPPLEAALAAKKKGLALAARETCV